MAKTRAEMQKEYSQRTGGAAQEKYKKLNVVRVALDLNRNTDADILSLLETVPSKQGFIKKAIRAYEDDEKKF
jgi:hypothetical protein